MEAQSDVKINIQAVKSSPLNVSLIAYVNFGHKIINPEIIRTVDLHWQFIITDEIKSYKEIYPHLKEKHLKEAEEYDGYFPFYIYKPSVVSTGIVLPKIFWDRKKKRAIGKYAYINDRLVEFKKHVSLLYNALSNNGKKKIEPEKLCEQIKLHITNKFKIGERLIHGKDISTKDKVTLPKIVIPGYYGNQVNGVPTLLINYIQYKIEKYTEDGPFLSGATPETMKVYTRLMNSLIEYKNATKQEIDLVNVSVAELKNFISYYIKKKKEDGTDYSINYLTWFKKEIRNFIHKAKTEDKVPYSKNLDLDDRFFEMTWHKEKDPYLTLEQVERLQNLDVTKEVKNEKEIYREVLNKKFPKNYDDTIELVKSMFLVAVASGSRVSDLKNIKYIFHNQRDGWYFEYTSEKTDSNVKVPVKSQYVLDLFTNKFNGEFEFKIAEQTFNEIIKLICLRAGLTQPFLKSTVDIHTTKQVTNHSPLWSNITSKTARKTFASLMVREHLIPLAVVKTWTGHSTEASLKNYIQLSESDYYEISLRLADLLKKVED